MSLLQNLPYNDYQIALKLTTEQCTHIASIARLKNIQFNDAKKPGELLLKNLDRRGYTVQQYKSFLSTLSTKQQKFYKPNSKVGILIGNDKYVHLPKLATPPGDCNLLSSRLTNMGFTVIILKNTTANALKVICSKIFQAVPKDSYCLIFYAGHGCELNNTTCILGVDCPSENIEDKHCVTQDYLLGEAGKCGLDLCILILDMCRNTLESKPNQPPITETINSSKMNNHKNLIICYTTQSSECAYEVLELIDYSENLDTNMTYELRTSDLANVVVDGSQYVNALCKHLGKDADFDWILDKVHQDLEDAVKQQKPLKLKFGDGKRSLHDPAIGNVNDFLNKLEEIGKEFNTIM